MNTPTDIDAFKKRARRAPLTKLAGDASGREYFRIWMKGYAPETAAKNQQPFSPHPFSTSIRKK